MWSPVQSSCSTITTSSSLSPSSSLQSSSGSRGEYDTTLGSSNDRSIITTGGCPTSRCKHAMCSGHDGYIYLVGGRSGSLPLKDVWRFDPETCSWDEIKGKGEDHPPNLQEHTIVSFNNKLIIFGGEIGFAPDEETPLWILDLETYKWRKQASPSGQLSPGTTLVSPSGRRGHSAVVFDFGLHVYGGYQDLKGSSNELWTFDLDTEQWHLFTCSGKKSGYPSGRHWHSAVVDSEFMYVFGGMSGLQEKNDLWRWNFVSKRWQKIKTNKGPGGMHSHSAVNFNGSMFVFGGERKGVLLNELWKFDFVCNSWTKIMTEGGLTPTPRSKHTAVLTPGVRILREQPSLQLDLQDNRTEENNHHNLHHREAYVMEDIMSPESDKSIEANLPRNSFISISTWTLELSSCSPRVKLRRPPAAPPATNNAVVTRNPAIRRSWSSYSPTTIHKGVGKSQSGNNLYNTIRKSISRPERKTFHSYEEEEEEMEEENTNNSGENHGEYETSFIESSSNNKQSNDSEWKLCMYIFGGRESGSSFSKKPISAWKLYV